MAKYTIDIYNLLKDEDFKLFSFNYNFYTDDEQVKLNFEKKFIDTFMFNEIGFETVARFKHFLRTRLNNIMPYYKQLYETEVRSKDIDFMLNKDLMETFTRDISSNLESNSNSTSVNNNTSSHDTTQDIINTFKESNLENGNASLSLTSSSLTNVNETADKLTSVNTIESNDNSDVTNLINTNNIEKETTTLTSQGNIGVTSSAELLEKWRKVLINIDNMILEECKDLFMMVY